MARRHLAGMRPDGKRVRKKVRGRTRAEVVAKPKEIRLCRVYNPVLALLSGGQSDAVAEIGCRGPGSCHIP
jgi:hypothetical protein